MGLIDNLKDVADLVRKAGDTELYRRITALEGEVIDLTRANRHLELENEDLKGKLAVRAAMTFKPPFWYVEGDDVPYCPQCWEADAKQVHLQGPDEVGAGMRFDCPNCKQMFITDRRDPSPVQRYHPRSPWS